MTHQMLQAVKNDAQWRNTVIDLFEVSCLEIMIQQERLCLLSRESIKLRTHMSSHFLLHATASLYPPIIMRENRETLFLVKESRTSPPNCPTLACEWFWAEATEDPKYARRAFYFPLNCLEEFRYRAWSRKKALTRDNYQEYSKLGGRWAGTEFLCGSHCFCLVWQTFVYQNFALLIFLCVFFLYEAPNHRPVILRSGWDISSIAYCLRSSHVYQGSCMYNIIIRFISC